MLIDKKSFRKVCKKRLEISSKRAKLYKDKLIQKKLLKIIKSYKPKKILLYIPFGFEADIRPIINIMRKKCTVFVPFMESVSFKIVKYRLPLREKRFSIKEPLNSSLKIDEVDMAVVPVLGVGRDYKRVGFGKGMYDRFFANLKKRPTTIFVQIEKCFNKKATTDKFDIQSDFYVTPKKIYITRGKRDVRRDFNSRSRLDSGRSFRRNYPKKAGVVKI